ncbi:hypothetical protein P154DRAFT_338034 [Amniculicola lignicola CBS 123094]|uniref:Uncharacterized protein n=1 Tax=Amniculicola lignicola CBS 123094 TaxID=1392246 RepID=A0A6A5WUP7_9PLEO|nr:hypothetical protein P154DRAFT_338034 [Amniculicola lignicola CBS 123094]
MSNTIITPLYSTPLYSTLLYSITLPSITLPSITLLSITLPFYPTLFSLTPYRIEELPALEVDYLILLSSNTQINSALIIINMKLKQLKTIGLILGN